MSPPQAEIYRQVFAPFEGRRVVVRTLDAGADKPLAFADLGAEENPALGRRGLRLSAERPDLLGAQLEALSIGASDTGADVRVMAPMVALVEEAAWFARRVRENGLKSVGVMIEVPGAASRSAHVLEEVDFGSLGTNDLAQYTMAADRMQGELSDLLDPWQPALPGGVAAASDGAACAVPSHLLRLSAARASGQVREDRLRRQGGRLGGDRKRTCRYLVRFVARSPSLDQ